MKETKKKFFVLFLALTLLITGNGFGVPFSLNVEAANKTELTVKMVEVVNIIEPGQFNTLLFSEPYIGKIYDETPDIKVKVTLTDLDDATPDIVVNDAEGIICDVNGVAMTNVLGDTVDWQSNKVIGVVDYDHVKLKTVNLNSSDDAKYSFTVNQTTVYQTPVVSDTDSSHQTFNIFPKEVDIDATLEEKEYDSTNILKIKSLKVQGTSTEINPYVFDATLCNSDGTNLTDSSLPKSSVSAPAGKYSNAKISVNYGVIMGFGIEYTTNDQLNYVPILQKIDTTNPSDPSPVYKINTLNSAIPVLPNKINAVLGSSIRNEGTSGKNMIGDKLTATFTMPGANDITFNGNLQALMTQNEIKGYDGDATLAKTHIIDDAKSKENLNYKWTSGTDIVLEGKGDEFKSYVIKSSDSQKDIKCEISLTGNLSGATTSQALKVSEKTQLTGTISVAGNLTEGTNLKAAPSFSQKSLNFTYQWYRNNAEITAATNDNYTLVRNDIGKNIKVVATIVNDNYQGTAEIAHDIPAVAPGVATDVNFNFNQINGQLSISYKMPDWFGGSTISNPLTAATFNIVYNGAAENILNADTYDENTKTCTKVINNVAPNKEFSVIIQIKNDAQISSKTKSQTFKTPRKTMTTNNTNVTGIQESYKTNGSQIIPTDIVIKDRMKKLTDKVDYELNYGTNVTCGTDAGSVTITFKGDYDGAFTKTFNIVTNVPKVSTPTATQPNCEYKGVEITVGATGEIQESSLTNASNPTGLIYYVYTKENIEPTTVPSKNILPQDVGVYYIWAYFVGDVSNTSAWSSSLKYTINKDIIEVKDIPSPLVNKNGKYNTTDTLNEYPLLDAPDTHYGTWDWVNKTTLIKPGENKAKAKFVVDEKYLTNYDFTRIINRDISFTVAKGNPSGSVSLTGWCYGDLAIKPTITSNTNDVSSAIVEYKLASAEDSTYSTKVPTQLGNYVVRVTLAATVNFDRLIATTGFAISPKEVNSPTITGINDAYSYTGNKIEPKGYKIVFNLKNLEEGTDYVVTYGTNTKIGATIGEVIFTFTGNYSGTVTKTFAITAKELTSSNIIVENLETSYEYTGSSIKPESISIKESTNTLETPKDYEVTYGTNTAVGDTTGKVIITFAGNYSGTVEKTFTINKAKVALTAPTIKNNNRTYNKKALEAGTDFNESTLNKLQVNKGNIYYVYTIDNVIPTSIPTENNLPINAGHYYIWAYYSGDINSEPVISSSMEFVVNQKEITITPTKNLRKTEGEIDPEITYKVIGLVTGDSLNGKLSRESGEAVGTYKIQLGSVDNANYVMTLNKEVFTINEKVKEEPKLERPTISTSDQINSNPKKKELADQLFAEFNSLTNKPQGLLEAIKGSLNLGSDATLSFDIQLMGLDINNYGNVSELKFDIKPFYLLSGSTKQNMIGNDSLNGSLIKFQLPIPFETTEKYAKLTHYLANGQTETSFLEIQNSGKQKFVVAKAKSFSEFSIVFTNSKDEIKPIKPLPETPTIDKDNKVDTNDYTNVSLFAGILFGALCMLTISSLKSKKKFDI